MHGTYIVNNGPKKGARYPFRSVHVAYKFLPTKNYIPCTSIRTGLAKAPYSATSWAIGALDRLAVA